MRMTLREFGRVVWFNRVLIVLTMLIAVALAGLYSERQSPSFASTAQVQFASADALSGAGIHLDTDPAILGAQATRAAAMSTVPPGTELLGVSGAFSSAGPTQVDVTADSSTPESAAALANAFARAYVDTLQQQLKDGLASLESRRDQLGQWLQANQPSAAGGNNGAIDIAQAQYASSMSQYQALLQQIANANVLPSIASLRSNAVGAVQTSMSTTTLLVVAALLGLFLGISAAVVRHSLDTKVRSNAGVRRSGVRHLGTLAAVGASEKASYRTGALPVAQRVATPFTQTLRELRTTIQAALGGEGGSVLVVTSTEPNRGCSFIAANLAASFALSGRRVIVVSGDLRQPRLTGLVLSGQSEVVTDRWALRDSDVPNMRVLPDLHTSLDPADYLATEEVRDLLQRLRGEADVVVLDSPPVLAAADAAILGSYADGVVLTVRAGTTHVGAIDDAAERLDAANARLLGVVLATDRAPRGAHLSTYAFLEGPTGDAATSGSPEVANGPEEPSVRATADADEIRESEGSYEPSFAMHQP